MSGHEDDPELRALFVDEMRRHFTAFVETKGNATARARTLHAMRGAAAMMGLGDVALKLGEIEQATRAGDVDAGERAYGEIDALLRAGGFEIDVLVRAAAAIPAGSARRGVSPLPRPSDRPSLDPEVLAFFFTEGRARIERLGESLDGLARNAGVDALDEAFRHVHALKGAASTVGLGSIARGAHALEAAFIAIKARSHEVTGADIDVLATARAHLAVALSTPQSAADEVEVLVAGLRAAGLVRDHDLQPVAQLSRDRSRDSAVAVDAMRVPVHAVARLAESVNDMGSLGDRVVAHAMAVQDFARVVQSASRAVHDALQRIGPPRPWGAPADALERLQSVEREMASSAVELDREGDRIARDAESLESIAGAARDSLQRLGASSARWLFDRVAPAADTLARSESKQIVIVRQGDEVEIPRALAERLVEPLAQLVRNAVTHGVESPSRRLARSKPSRASLRLTASVQAARLRIAIEDDGAGVDLEAVAVRAESLGLITASQTGDAEAVLATLFLPRVTTRTTVDAAAGRGVGLDLVHREVTALGGQVSVTTRRGAYTRFVIEIAMHQLAQRMLLVRAGNELVALPLDRVVGVLGNEEELAGAPIVSLRDVLGVRAGESTLNPPIVLLLSTDGAIGLRVDSVDRAREFVVRPLPPLLLGVRPWAGLTADGSANVILLADVDRLLETP